jgi:hypothetical protein
MSSPSQGTTGISRRAAQLRGPSVDRLPATARPRRLANNENIPPSDHLPSLNSLLKPSPALSFRRPLRHRQRPPNGSLNFVHNTGDTAQRAAEELEEQQTDARWLSNVRREIWTTLRREADEEHERQSLDSLGKKGLGGRSLSKEGYSTFLDQIPSPSLVGKGASRRWTQQGAPLEASPPVPRHSTPPQDNDHVTKSPPFISPASVEPLPTPATLLNSLPRLSTADLPPLRHHLRTSGTIEILSCDDRQVLLDFRAKSGPVILISGDGERVRCLPLLRLSHR